MFSIVTPRYDRSRAPIKARCGKIILKILGVVPIVESNPRLKNVVIGSSIYTIQTGSPNYTTHVVI